MSEFLGGIPEQMLDFARRAQTHGRRLDEVAADILARSEMVDWHGPDAQAFTERVRAEVCPRMVDVALGLDASAREIARHAAEQDLASSADGRIDSGPYAQVIGGEGIISDIINGAQDAWDGRPGWLGGGNRKTIDDFGGRYIDTPEGQDFRPEDVDLSEDAIREQIMRQGSLGDCWLLAALMSTASTDPGFLAENISLRDDGTWDVTLYEDGEPVVVNVSPDQLAADLARVDDDGEENYWADDPIGWMSIYEQAAINHLGPDYESVIADTPGRGLELVTGAPAREGHFHQSIEDLDTALREGRPVTAMSDPLLDYVPGPLDVWRDDVAGAHVYQVSAVDVENGTVTLLNPWGETGSPGDENHRPRELTISMQDYNAHFVMTGYGSTSDEFGG